MEVEDWREIRRLHASGMAIKAITRELAISRNTVRKALAMPDPPGPRRRRTGSAIDPFEPRIRALVTEEPGITATEIARRIGWDRSMTVLKERVRLVRAEVPAEGRSAGPGGRLPVLPAASNSFVGRRAEIASVRQALVSSRLMTLTGPGGVGKSRLALQAAGEMRRSFSEGMWLVELAELRDPERLAGTVAEQLDLAPGGDTGGRGPVELLTAFLHTRRALLVLDNCEHLLEACGDLVDTLLRAAPRLRVLATSRTALALPGEHVLPVAPLPVPEPGSAAADEDGAVALFAARASSVINGFAITPDNNAAVARVCARLDGLPLAIELATARLRALSVTELADKLDAHTDVLAGVARHGPERQRGLRPSADWSHALCTPDEQLFWARAAIFAGGFELTAAAEVCCDAELPEQVLLDVVSGLVSKSILVREERSGRVRFRMLETIREYGRSRLAPGDWAELRARHLAHFAGLIDRSVERWFGAEQEECCLRLAEERANLRYALRTAVGSGVSGAGPGAGRSALHLVGAPWFLWAALLPLAEHGRWLGRALDADPEPSSVRCEALLTHALVATLSGDHPLAGERLAEADELAGKLADAYLAARALHHRGLLDLLAGRLDRSGAELEEALRRYQDCPVPPDVLALLRLGLGMHAALAERTAAAQGHFEWVRSRCAVSGERWLRSYAAHGLGLVALRTGDTVGAVEHATESLRLGRVFDDAVARSLALELLAWAEASGGDGERSAVLLGAASGTWDSVGTRLYGTTWWYADRARVASLAREQAGDAVYQVELARGRALDREAVLRFALRERSKRSRAAEGGSALTGREREVAALVAEGLTNREIAQRLTISHRTVEGHVERVLTKLGLARRSQIARWLADRRPAGPAPELPSAQGV
jgi:predicted ATPase/DNA-binding CsgD family transcriptional regulator